MDKKLRLVITGEVQSALNSLNRLKSHVDGLQGTAGRLRKWGTDLEDSGKRLARGIAVTGAAAGTALLLLGGKAIQAASDLNESVNAVNVVFGEASGKIEKFGKDSAESIGLSTRAFNQMATPLGAMLQNAGLGADKAADSTINLTKRAADMASVFNTDVSEAMTAIQAAMRGEADPIERFGVNMSAAAVQAEALALGINKSWNEMTAEEKATARLSAFFKQTDKVAGDFANTSGELANQQRITAAETENLGARIGKNLIPVQAAAVEGAGWLLDNMGELGKAFELGFTGDQDPGFVTGQIGNFFFQVGEFAREAAPHVEKIGSVLSDVGKAIANFFKENPAVLFAVLGTILGGVVLWGVLALTAALVGLVGTFGLITAAVALVVGALTYAYTNWEWFRKGVDVVVAWFRDTAAPALGEFARWVGEQFQNFVDWVREIWPQVQEAVGHALAVVSAIIAGFIAGALWLWDVFGKTILEFARSAWDAIKGTIDAAIKVISGIINFVLAIINGDWSRAWEAIRQIVSGVWEWIKSIIGLALAVVKLIISAAWEWVKTQTLLLWEGIKAGVSAAINWVKDRIASVLETIKGGWNSAWDGMKNVASDIWDGIKRGVVNGANMVIDAINWFIDKLNKIPGVNIPLIGHISAGGGGGGDGRGMGSRVGGGGGSLRRAQGGSIHGSARVWTGEGDPRFPEAVIATDPRYRARNLQLLQWAADRLGVPMGGQGGGGKFQVGGIVGGIGDAVGGALGAAGDALGSVGSFLRDLTAVALKPIAEAAKTTIRAITPDALRTVQGVGIEAVDQLYRWGAGKAEEEKRKQAAAVAKHGGDAGTVGAGSGPQGLKGAAAAAYPVFRRMFPGMVIGGYRARGSVPGSDHPKGLAMDLMTTSNAVAQQIISTFMGQAGKKYWIWNRQSASASRGWRPFPYRGPSPHTDHVHLSYYMARRGMIIPALQNGAWRTKEGPAWLHDDEMVAPKRLADELRAALSGSGPAGRGGAPLIGEMNFHEVKATSGDIARDISWEIRKFEGS